MTPDDLQLREFAEPVWYRIEGKRDRDHLYIRKLHVEKHTPKGAWLKDYEGRRFVLRDYAHRGRAFAAPTLAQAKEDFHKRKEYHIKMLERRLWYAQRDLNLLLVNAFE